MGKVIIALFFLVFFTWEKLSKNALLCIIVRIFISLSLFTLHRSQLKGQFSYFSLPHILYRRKKEKKKRKKGKEKKKNNTHTKTCRQVFQISMKITDVTHQNSFHPEQGWYSHRVTEIFLPADKALSQTEAGSTLLSRNDYHNFTVKHPMLWDWKETFDLIASTDLPYRWWSILTVKITRLSICLFGTEHAEA